MDPERARELLAQERERIERALRGLRHTDTGEEADEFDPANLGSDLYQDELDEGLAEGLRAELAAGERGRASRVECRPPGPGSGLRRRRPAPPKPQGRRRERPNHAAPGWRTPSC